MDRKQFEALVQAGPLFLDGATGSNLMKAGKPVGVCSETWILEHPDVLIDLQRSYVASGSRVLIAPTFTANRYYLAQHGVEQHVAQMNRDLVALSRQAAGKAFVAGDMTTLGRPDLSYEEHLRVYEEQSAALAEAGVDLYIIETMMGLEETMAALEACRMVSDLPVICSFSVTGDGMLYFGGSIYEAAPQLEGFGADAVGINCSAGPDQMETVIRGLVSCLQIPVSAKPNAGMPVMDENGVAQYSMTPVDFGRHMKVLYDSGARLLGGCCGTEPAHIAELVRACG